MGKIDEDVIWLAILAVMLGIGYMLFGDKLKKGTANVMYSTSQKLRDWAGGLEKSWLDGLTTPGRIRTGSTVSGPPGPVSQQSSSPEVPGTGFTEEELFGMGYTPADLAAIYGPGDFSGEGS